MTPPANAPPLPTNSPWNAQRTLSGCAALLGLGASLWAALGIGDCGTCHAAGDQAFRTAIAWAGVAFYTLLTLTIAGWKHSRWTTAGFLAAAGVHAVLLALLFLQHAFCAPCITAGSAAFIGAAGSAAARPRPGIWRATAVFTAAALVTLAAVGIGKPFQDQATEVPQPRPSLFSQEAPANGRVTLILYEREGCKHCLDFEENVLPPIQRTFGDSLRIERRDAEIDMESPTIIVQGKAERKFVGEIDAPALEAAIREVR